MDSKVAWFTAIAYIVGVMGPCVFFLIAIMPIDSGSTPKTPKLKKGRCEFCEDNRLVVDESGNIFRSTRSVMFDKSNCPRCRK